ncbi:MAG: 3-dehydroquinate synthase [Anaerolineales bacterium]|nr:3-dehydroquinate synthase [Anaerolineales bacterium]
MWLFLYGPPGSGKTTLGRRLAEKLDRAFYDLDELIAQEAKMGIPELFASEGEARFRQRESQALHRLLPTTDGVLALGGGALLQPANRELVERSGCVVTLQAQHAVLVERLQASAGGRPLLDGDLGERLQRLLEQRAAHYASFPLQVDTSNLDGDGALARLQEVAGLYRARGMGAAYDVRVQAGGLAGIGEALGGLALNSPLALVSDANVAPHYADQVEASLQGAGFQTSRLVLPSGEAGKNLDTVLRLWEGFLSAGLERGGGVLALGGGVVSDLAGFAAATYMRGVAWVALPTTLLAMVDASLGGKTGFDLPQGKNLVGAFHPPRLVLSDPQTLHTLPQAEMLNGMAEVVKTGVVGDAALFDLVARGWEAVQAELRSVICRALAVKLAIIEADPYERGLRAALNFGHTVGHALESTLDYRLPHGQAVASGMLVEARLAVRLGVAQPGVAESLQQALQALGLPSRLPPEAAAAAIIAAMGADKKRAGRKLRFALPERVGRVLPGVVLEEESALRWALEDSRL